MLQFSILVVVDSFVIGEQTEPKPRFEVVELIEVTRSVVEAWNRTKPTIAILPTALFEGELINAFMMLIVKSVCNTA